MSIYGTHGGIEVISIAIVTFFNPAYAVAINASIGIVGTAAIEVCGQFVKAE
ncbi:MAG: hypothetical protein U0M02_09385 [Acutalibacteraceae bacterium]|nr:hypothetical protein [Acutalibacteraceae bacterium]